MFLCALLSSGMAIRNPAFLLLSFLLCASCCEIEFLAPQSFSMHASESVELRLEVVLNITTLPIGHVFFFLHSCGHPQTRRPKCICGTQARRSLPTVDRLLLNGRTMVHSHFWPPQLPISPIPCAHRVRYHPSSHNTLISCASPSLLLQCVACSHTFVVQHATRQSCSAKTIEPV
jgi:hypothetical protein